MRVRHAVCLASTVSGLISCGGRGIGTGASSEATNGSPTANGSSASVAGGSGTASTSGPGTASSAGANASGGSTTSVSGSSAGASGSGGGSSGSTSAGGSSANSSSASSSSYVNPFGCKFAWGEPAPTGSLASETWLQFMTAWAGYEITAAGTIDECDNCGGLLKQVASTNLIPVYYAYFIGYYGHVNGLPDQNCCGTSCVTCTASQPNLTTGMAYLLTGAANAACPQTTPATFCADNLIVQAYAWYAQQSYKAWPTKPLVWLLEGDFIQYTDASQVDSTTGTTGTSVPLSLTQLGQLAALITTAIKSNMPNAIVAIDNSNWISNTSKNPMMTNYWNAMAQANYDMVWTTGVADAGGYLLAGTTATSSTADQNYAFLASLTGKKIYVDQWSPDTWSNQSAATINALIGDGVVALNSNDVPTGYQTNVTALEPQLDSTCP